jgi:pyridoxine 5-phosphate synthase
VAVLGVNIDHVATVRQARGAAFPDPVEAALVCERAGARAIVAHLREDRRHIQDADVLRLKRRLRVKFNMEISTDRSVLRTALRVRPDAVTFVPERRRERTTEAGVDAAGLRRKLAAIIRSMRREGIGVSLFVDPIGAQLEAARDLGADAVEIHTGAYANARTARARERAALAVGQAVRAARALGLLTHVGHGLDYANVPRIARIPGIEEFNIGYAIVARALFTGLARAVRDMKRLVEGRGAR